MASTPVIPPELERSRLSRINTNLTYSVYDDPWEGTPSVSPANPYSATSRTSSGPNGVAKSLDAILEGSTTRVKAPTARNEARKLLSHVLTQLANRERPPSIVDYFRTHASYSPERGIAAFADSLKQAVRRRGNTSYKRDQAVTGNAEDDSDEETDVFSTDNTIELVLQLINVLVVAIDRKWQIFDDNYLDTQEIDADESKLSYSFRKSRYNLKNGSKHLRSASPARGRSQVPELLSLCLSILRSIVLEDCRYRVASPRPSRPPNTLQMQMLNVAEVLLYSHRHDARVISEITFAFIPAFYTFPRQMLPRLLQFFEFSIIRVVLENLAHSQGTLHRDIVNETSAPYSAISNDLDVPNIQIDEVYSIDKLSEVPGEWESTNPSDDEVQSTNNPRQPLTVYYLAFVIPPLLSAILNTLDTIDDLDLSGSITTIATHIIQAVSASKIDAYNDLLEVIAYQGSKSRRWAISLLSELWPHAVGHTIISNPFPFACHTMNKQSHINLHTSHQHHFVPWYFEQKRPCTDGVLHSDCRSCLKPIHGFSLMCPYCMTAIHFGCYDYNRGNYYIQYTPANEQVQRIVLLRFSQLSHPGHYTWDASQNNHVFRPTNWFTLCLCFVCRKPLWGCFAQGLKCEQCPVALHQYCLPSLEKHRCGSFDITLNNVSISLDTLKESCLDHFPILRSSAQDLERCSYEELSIYKSVLRTQVQILRNGLIVGSVVINTRTSMSHEGITGIDYFQLHSTLEQCERLLATEKSPLSPLTQQYIQDSSNIQQPTLIMFNWSFLEYITATIKTAYPQSRHDPTTASQFLKVDHLFNEHSTIAEAPSLPYESVTLLHIRSILRRDFALHSDDAAKFMLDHLHHLSFFDRTDKNPFPFENVTFQSNLKCIFPLPLGLDLSMNVETLVSSIEASLSDLDLTVNEFGFLLLTRRFWPNGLASEYGLRRLSLKVLSWILCEDKDLAIILRRYVAKQQNLPGIRSHHNEDPWTQQTGSRLSPNESPTNNGGDFVSARRLLLSRFAFPWLLQLHELDAAFYCQVIFEACCRVAENIDGNFETRNPLDKASDNGNIHAHCDDILRSILALSQCSVIFSVFDDLFLRWMDYIARHGSKEHLYPSLSRLFKDNEAAPTTASSNLSLESTDTPRHSVNDINPLRAISSSASQSELGLSTSLAYLPMLINSGVDIPISTYKHLSSLLISNKKSSLENADSLTKAIALTLWTKPSGGQELQDILASLHHHLSSQIFQCLVTGDNPGVSLSVIQQSFIGCLRIYGCNKDSIITSGLSSSLPVEDMPSQRKASGRTYVSDEPIFIHSRILDAIALYIQSKVDEVTCYIAKFLYMFLTESPLLESFEIDNFILQNGRVLASCTWVAYNIQREDIAISRTGLLLRCLLIDPEPLHDIVSINMDPSMSSVKDRLLGMNRLFRMVLDVTSPVFQMEGRHWRSSVIDIFSWYFSPLWADPSEEVRIAAKSSSAALLPAHLDIISQCWSESILNSPITERNRLVRFLLQLHAHFPSWKVLSWDCMIETLVEYDSHNPKGTDDNVHLEANKNGHLSVADPDMTSLRASIVVLGLQMLADGIEIDSFSLMKLKIQLVQIIEFNKISVVPTQSRQSFRLIFNDIVEIPGHAYSCIEELVHVMDAAYYMKAPRSALGINDNDEDELEGVLIGSVFLDVILCILATLPEIYSLPVLTLKRLLEALYIIIHKFDFSDKLFQHLQHLVRKAIAQAVEMLSSDMNYELRQLSLSVAHLATKKCQAVLGPSGISDILEIVVAEIASHNGSNQDALIAHGKNLVETTLEAFSDKGLLFILLKRPLQPSMFVVLKQVLHVQGNETAVVPSLSELLLLDTLRRTVEHGDPKSFPLMLENIARFVEVVLSSTNCTAEFMTSSGRYLDHIGRRMLDGSLEGLDCSALITVFSVLISKNKKQGQRLLPHAENVIRLVLTRLRVKGTCLLQLIKAVVPNRLKSNDNSANFEIVDLLFDVLLDGFRIKTRMSPTTMKALTESLISADQDGLFSSSISQKHSLLNMVDDAYYFLQNHNWNEAEVDHGFQAVLTATKLILEAGNRVPGHFQRLVESTVEKSARTPPTMRTWNFFVLVTLQQSQEDWKYMIYEQFANFCHVYSVTLRTYISSGISSAAAATTDINQAHVALKLWLMVAHSVTVHTHSGESPLAIIWNELWPLYENFLNVLDTEARVGPYPALISLASTSVADLVLYMRSLKASLSLETSLFITILSRLRSMSLGDSSSHKIIRTLSLLEEPAVQVPNSVLLDQILKELLAAEKFRTMERK